MFSWNVCVRCSNLYYIRSANVSEIKLVLQTVLLLFFFDPGIVIIIIFLAHQHKAAGMKIKQKRDNDHNGVSQWRVVISKGDRVPPLESNGHSLEQECGFSDIVCDYYYYYYYYYFFFF